MDPHSTWSQFNQRTAKSGPMPINPRFAEPMPHHKSTAETFVKSQTTVVNKHDVGLLRRPIATNSRIKQDEKYKKDMYLAFVHNALQQKSSGITENFDELVDYFNPKKWSSQEFLHTAQLRLWVSVLSHVVSRLEHIHSALVHAVLNLPWTTLDSATVKAYTILIGMLISARPEYLSLVLDRIVQGFTYQSSQQLLHTNIQWESSTTITRQLLYDRQHSLLQHLLSLVPTLPSTLQPILVKNFPHKRQNQITQITYIRNLLRVSVYSPELADKILATIVDRAIQMDVEIQIELEELDTMAENAPVREIFELDPIDGVVGSDSGDSDNDSDDDDSDDLSDFSSDGGNNEDDADLPTNVVYIQEMVKKLDAILSLILDHFHDYSSSAVPSGTTPPLPELPSLDPPSSISLTSPFAQMPPGTTSFSSSPQPSLPDTIPSALREQSKNEERRTSQLRARFLTLLSIFDRTILRTFKSRYTQFLVFWYSSLDPEFSDLFQGMLVDRALFEFSADEPTRTVTPVVTRAAAASYIGGFVSRANFVNKGDARRIVGILCEFLNAHLDGIEELMNDSGTKNNLVAVGGMDQNTVFYAVVQAVFLIFCFRWRDLLEEQEEDGLLGGSSVAHARNKWIPQLSILQRVVTSVLNPLMVCSSTVVMQFARVAQATGFIYCYTILESNRRLEHVHNLAEARSNSTFNAGVHSVVLQGNINPELNTFFPFDPYRLPRSFPYIQKIYREWATVAIDEEEEDDEDEVEVGDDDHGDRQTSNFVPSRPLSIARPCPQGDEGGIGESLEKMNISPTILVE